MTTKMSISTLRMLDTCLRKYYFLKILKMRPEPVIYFVLGRRIHEFIAYSVHKETKDGRTHFYSDSDSAVNAWGASWWRYWNDNQKKLYPLNGAQAAKAHNDGAICIQNYYELSKKRQRPIMFERPMNRYIPELDVNLTGIIDQVRPVNVAWQKSNGKLVNPKQVVLADIKSGRTDYWWDHPAATMEHQAKTQTSLRNNIQATAYYMLYEYCYGDTPAAFCFWMLGGEEGKVYSTERSDSDYEEFVGTLRYYIEFITNNLNKEDYPKTPNDYACRNCEVWNYCSQDTVMVSLPATANSKDDLKAERRHIRPTPNEPEGVQLRMKFKKRKKKEGDDD